MYLGSHTHTAAHLQKGQMLRTVARLDLKFSSWAQIIHQGQKTWLVTVITITSNTFFPEISICFTITLSVWTTSIFFFEHLESLNTCLCLLFSANRKPQGRNKIQNKQYPLWEKQMNSISHMHNSTSKIYQCKGYRLANSIASMSIFKILVIVHYVKRTLLLGIIHRNV